MNKSVIALIVAIIVALAGWFFALKNNMSGPDAPTTSPSNNAVTVTKDNSAELEAQADALRMAEQQLADAKAEQERRISEVQARLEREEAAREKANAQVKALEDRINALVASLDEAKKKQDAMLAAQGKENESLKSEMAEADAAVKRAQEEAARLKEQKAKLEQERLDALARQEKIEKELRAELEKYQQIEDWDYSYLVVPDTYKRRSHEMMQSKITANPSHQREDS